MQSGYFQFIPLPLKHDLTENFIRYQAPVINIRIVFVFLYKIRVGLDTVGDTHKFYPLFFWGGVPALEAALIKIGDRLRYISGES